MTIDPKLAERRKTVAENKAKRNLSRLLKFLAAVVVVGSVVWLLFSPWLSVSRVDTNGIDVSAGQSILADLRVVAGTPMILVGADSTESALLEDPWIAEAQVEKIWPNFVTVDVVERSPVAWARTEGGWTRRAIDGVALPSEPEPDDVMGRIEMPGLADVAAETAPDMLGALEFVEALPTSLHSGTVVTTDAGELWATVQGYQVRLGRPAEMREKALSLHALLQEQIPEGSLLNLIAPTIPSFLPPGAGEETGEDDQSTEDESTQGENATEGQSSEE